MLIETKRTLIRPFCAGDLDDLQEILGDPLVMAQVEPPYTREKTRAFLMDFCIAQGRALAVALRPGGRLIGYALCSDRLEAGVYVLGWLFNRAIWRQGLAHESIRALIRHLFLESGAHKVFAEAIDVEKSVPLMIKLGMRREGVQRLHTRDLQGVWRDLHYYGLLLEEYLAMNPPAR